MLRIGRSSLVLMIPLVALLFVSRALHADAPGQVSFQAQLKDSTGKPLPDGRVARVVFRLYSDPATQSFLWGEAHRDVAISRGVVSVFLGNGQDTVAADGSTTSGANSLRAALFDGTTRYLTISVDTGTGEKLVGSPIPFVSVPYALSAASINGHTDQSLVPVGTIVDWFRPAATTPTPDGWKICDGSTVSDALSPFNGKNVPDLRNRFVLGIDASNATVMASYGADQGAPPSGGQSAVGLSLAHSHTVPAHSHTISPDGQHAHTGSTGGQINDPPFGGPSGFGSWVIPHHHDFTTNAAGSHNHGGQTGQQPATQTDTQLGNVTVPTVPPFVGLLKIIRVK